MARLLPNGSLDTTFRADPDTGWDAAVSSIAVQPDGAIVVAGGFFAINGVARPRVARLVADPAWPSLDIARSGDMVMLSWSSTRLDLQLTASVDLKVAGAWPPVDAPAITIDGTTSVAIPMGSSHTFFRLEQR